MDDGETTLRLTAKVYRTLLMGLCLTLCWNETSVRVHAADENFGTIKGQILLTGEIPKVKPLDLKSAKDSEICGPTAPNESLLVDEESQGVANVFVYIHKPKSVHPQLRKPDSQDVIVDLKKCRFVPHASLMRVNQTLRFKSQDPIPHNPHLFPVLNTRFGAIITSRDFSFKPEEAERQPMEVRCDLHPWMKAYVLVLDHPYAAITDSQGRFEIADLPAGTHAFTIWHECVGYLNRDYQITVTGGKSHDLGKISFSSEKFQSSQSR